MSTAGGEILAVMSQVVSKLSPYPGLKEVPCSLAVAETLDLSEKSQAPAEWIAANQSMMHAAWLDPDSLWRHASLGNGDRTRPRWP